MIYSLTAAAAAQTPAEIFQKMDSDRRARLAGIDEYSQMTTTLGMCTLEHFEKDPLDRRAP